MNGKVRRTGGLILTGENRSTRRKPCSSVSLCTINPTRTKCGPSVWDRPATNRLRQGTGHADRIRLIFIFFKDKYSELRGRCQLCQKAKASDARYRPQNKCRDAYRRPACRSIVNGKQWERWDADPQCGATVCGVRLAYTVPCWN